jgi:hypothetical protein
MIFKDKKDKEFVCRSCGMFLDSNELADGGCHCETDDDIFANDLKEEEEEEEEKIMELTDKAKVLFEEWLPSYFRIQDDKYLNYSDSDIVKKFNSKIKAMRYGVMFAFFDSIGINVSIEPYWSGGKVEKENKLSFDSMTFVKDETENDYSNHETRQLAVDKSIENGNRELNKI